MTPINISLNNDALAAVVGQVLERDLLVLALTCKEFLALCVAANGGHMRWVTGATDSTNRLQWAINVMGGKPKSSWCEALAARNNHDGIASLHMWHGVVPTADVLAEAAKGGHLGLVRKLRAKDPPCPWDEAARSHWSVSSWPFAAAEPHASSSHGQGGSCARSHWSVANWPFCAAKMHVPVLHGQGGSCARSHWSVANWPFCAAKLHAQ